MSDQAPRSPRRLPVVVTLYALLACVLIVGAVFYPRFFLYGPTRIQTTAELVTRVVLIATAVWFLFKIKALLEERWAARDESLSPVPPPPEISPDDLVKQQQDIREAIDLILQRYSPKVVGLFTKMLASSHYQVRVTEQAELLGNSVGIRVSIEYAMTNAERRDLEESEGSEQTSYGIQSIPVPVLKASKGTLLDSFDVTSEAGSALPVLSQKESRGLVVMALETLFYLTFNRASADPAEEKLQVAALGALSRFVSQMGRITTGPADTNGTTETASLEEAFDQAVASLQGPRTMARLQHLKNFCCFFAQNHVFVADVPTPPGTRFIVNYSKAVPLYGRTSKPDQRRTRFGLAPYKFWVPLNLAFTAESYHFRMDIGEGQFVADQYLADSSTGKHLTRDEISRLAPEGYVRVRAGSGLPYAHLYTRGLHKSAPRNWVTVVKFDEVPPGALGATAVVATVSAALVSLMTFIIGPANGPSADTAALLFAVPLFAATLVGHSIDRVQRSSLATYGALAVTGVTAFLGAVLFGLLPGMLSVTEVSVFGLLKLRSIHIGGLVIAIAAIGNVVFLGWRLKFKTQRYLEMLKRWDKPHLIGRE